MDKYATAISAACAFFSTICAGFVVYMNYFNGKRVWKKLIVDEKLNVIMKNLLSNYKKIEQNATNDPLANLNTKEKYFIFQQYDEEINGSITNCFVGKPGTITDILDGVLFKGLQIDVRKQDINDLIEYKRIKIIKDLTNKSNRICYYFILTDQSIKMGC